MENIITGPPLPTKFWNELNQNFGNYILNYIRKNEDRIYMINGETNEKLYLSELAERSSNLAVNLQDLGCKADTYAGIYSENRIDYMVALLAIFLSGATSVTLNHLYTLDELQHGVSLVKPVLLFCSRDTYLKAKEVQKNNSCIKHLIILGNAPAPDPNIKVYSKLIQKSNKKLQEPPFDPNRTLAILFSSGTTGLPKGVMQSHRNVLYMLHTIKVADLFHFEGKYCLSSLPMFHGYGMFVNFFTITLGQTLVFLKKYEEELFLSLIPKYKIKSLLLVPPMIVNLIKSDATSRYDLSSVDHIVCGSAPLKISTENEVKQKFGIKRVQQAYGMTESILSIIIKCKDNHKQGTCGTTIPGTWTKVVDPETNQSLGFGEVGEICIKGPSVMKGYINNEKATASTIRDGWLYSGDLGYYDEDGDYFIVDRLKELIKYNSFQVAPAELEEILLKHPQVKDAAVIGIPDEVAGELPKAFVVKKSNVTISEKELQDYVAGKVSPQKRLRGGVTFIDEIPKNPSGKILRRKLREQAAKCLQCKY